MKVQTRAPDETRFLASRLAKGMKPGTVVLLSGDLGLGKTCFAQGVAEGLGWDGPVNSPTFSLIQEFPTQPPLVHMDLYRIPSAESVWNLGLEEILESGAILLVEWWERCPELWPENAWSVLLTSSPQSPETRGIEISAPPGALNGLELSP